MKQFITAVLLFSVMHASHAQVKFAIKGGYNYATGKVSYNAIKQPTQGIHGFGLGVMAKAEFDGPLHFSPYIQVNRRGFITKPLTGLYKKIENTITYIDIVPALSLDFPKGNNAFVINFGPVASFTSFGREKRTDQNNVTVSEKMSFGYGEYGWFDLGAVGGIGYQMKKFFVEASYFHGLASINNNEEFDGRNIRNRMISLNFGYYIK